MSPSIQPATVNDDVMTDLSLAHQPSAPLPRAATSRRKRALDIALGSCLLLALAPLMLLIAVAVCVDSRGGVLYRSERVGFLGRRLRMAKFRKMHRQAEGLGLTTDDDPRFTRVGAWLCRLKLDELPQLWHLVTGEMTLVGPRPESPEFARWFADDFRHLVRVRPGLIGLSQLAFATENEILDDAEPLQHYVSALLPQKVRLDSLYVREWSFGLDLRILLWSFVAVLFRVPVAVHRETGQLGLRRR